MLPRPRRGDGGTRRVGVELELAGLGLDPIAGIIREVLGGEPRRESAFLCHVHGTELGDFRVELDAKILTQRRYRHVLDELGLEFHRTESGAAIEEALSGLAGLVVPHEIVAPPIPFEALRRLDQLRRALHAAGARGTQGSVFYAFGLQLNLELPDLAPATLRDYLRAFLVRYDWLVERGQIDFARKLTPYIRSFPPAYARRLFAPGYDPGQGELIDHYLHDNPTRNRPLDMLPLFAWLDPDRIGGAGVEHSLIKPRPTLHYRLPNCQIDDPDWSLASPWNDWVAIETLAADPQALAEVCRNYRGGRWQRLLAYLLPGRSP